MLTLTLLYSRPFSLTTSHPDSLVILIDQYVSEGETFQGLISYVLFRQDPPHQLLPSPELAFRLAPQTSVNVYFPAQ